MIIGLISIISCNQNEKNSDISNNEKKHKNELIKTEQKIKGTLQENLKIDSSLTTCNCPKPYSNASVQLKINCSKDYVKLCTWFYIDSTKSINEFQIFDKNDNLIFEGFPPSEYKVMRIEQPLIIRKMTTLPNKKGQWSLIPIYDIQIDKKNSQFTTNTKFIFESPKLEKTYQDSIYQIFKNQPQHNGDYDKYNPPFVNEDYIVNLFLCTLNGNSDCINAFYNLNTRFVTDGATGQLYTELLAILKVYEREMA